MKKIAIVIIMASMATQALSQSLEDYLAEAAANNPELKASFNDYLAAVERTPQAGSLPDPEAVFGYFTKPMETLMGNQRAEISLMQMFPWFGTLRLRKDEAFKMALARYEAFREQKNRLFYQVKETWYNLYLLEEQIRIQEQNLAIMRSLERIALEKFGSGGSSPIERSTASGVNSLPAQAPMDPAMGGMGMSDAPVTKSGRTSGMTMNAMPQSPMGTGGSMADVLRVQMEIKELESAIDFLKDSREPLAVEFNRLLNRPAGRPAPTPDTLIRKELPIDRSILLDSAIANSPMIRMYAAEEQAFATQKEMARKEGYPMFGVGFNYMIFSDQNSSEPGMAMSRGKDMIMPMVSVTIPIFRKNYNAKAKEAELWGEAAKFRQAAAESRLARDWKEAVKRMDDAERRIRLYEEQQKLAAQSIRLLTTAYSVQGSDFEEVLRMQTQLNDYRLKAAQAIVDQNIAAAQIEMLAALGLD